MKRKPLLTCGKAAMERGLQTFLMHFNILKKATNAVSTNPQHWLSSAHDTQGHAGVKLTLSLVHRMLALNCPAFPLHLCFPPFLFLCTFHQMLLSFSPTMLAPQGQAKLLWAISFTTKVAQLMSPYRSQTKQHEPISNTGRTLTFLPLGCPNDKYDK